jgi:hypothetical protein
MGFSTAQSGNGDFKRVAPDEYRVEVESYTIESGDRTRNKYNPDGRERVWFRLGILNIEGDEEAEVTFTDGTPIDEETRLMFFFDPDHVGLKPVVSKSRKFLASALGIPVDQDIEAETLEELAKSLVGRELIVVCGLNKNTGKNQIEDTRPVRRRQRRERAPLVDAAAKVFGDDAVSTEEEDAF